MYIQIIDLDGNKSEPIQLKGSIDHKNKFERNKIDEFDVGMLFLLSIFCRWIKRLFIYF